MSSPDLQPKRPHPAWLFPSGAIVAFVCSMCGVGGGLFAVPVLHFAHKLDLRRAVATSLALVLSTVVAATATEALHEDSALDWGLVGAMVAGALVGAQLGFSVARRIDARAVRTVFVVVLFLAGARVLFGGPAPSGGEDVVHGPLAYGAGAVIGLAGGFASPLLGIGGGLVYVPALYLAVPSLGFVGARAASLATSIAASSRSLWLYGRAGDVSPRRAAWFAGGAVIGAVAGTRAVHLPGVVEVARLSLGVILWYVAGRFAFELWRDRRAERSRESSDASP